MGGKASRQKKSRYSQRLGRYRIQLRIAAATPGATRINFLSSVGISTTAAAHTPRKNGTTPTQMGSACALTFGEVIFNAGCIRVRPDTGARANTRIAPPDIRRMRSEKPAAR